MRRLDRPTGRGYCGEVVNTSAPQYTEQNLRSARMRPGTHLIDWCRRFLRTTGFDLTQADGTLWGLLDSLFRLRNINCVIDVGAHFGEYARRLRFMGYTGSICSFEPVGESFEILQKAAARDPKWHVYHYALGRQDGQKRVNVASHSVFSSFLEPSEFSRSEFPGHTDVVNSQLVEMTTLDRVIGECVETIDSPNVFLKLDTQGYDFEVLAGARQSIGRIEALQSELSVLHCYQGMKSFTDGLASIQALGFCISGLFPVGRTSDLRLIEGDCVLVRQAGDSRAAVEF